MVRAHLKQPSEDKDKRRTLPKTSSSKPTSPRTAQAEGIWVCKLNGCNNTYAREADLKRHQRTSRQHVQPNSKPVACPHCRATFTRTDALRRHQKSRHRVTMVTEYTFTDEVDEEDSAPTTPDASASDCVQTYARYSEVTAAMPSLRYYRPHLTLGPLSAPYQATGTQIPTSQARLHASDSAYGPEGANSSISISPTSSHGSASSNYTPGVYYRSPTGEPVIPSPHFVAPGLRSLQAAAMAVASDREAGNPQNSVRAPDTSSDMIDPALRDMPPSPMTERQTRGREPTVEEMGLKESGLSPDVQKAVEVVLSINPDAVTDAMDVEHTPPLPSNDTVQPASLAGGPSGPTSHISMPGELSQASPLGQHS